MPLSVEGQIPNLETEHSIRLVSFNINGFKTLNHYHPWNDLSTLSDVFQYLKADVITFQELKLQRIDITREIANIGGFHTFITLPRTKRGYSGVGVFVKSTRDDMKVIKVEEGITGYLDVLTESTLSYRKIWERDGESGLAIGGYTDNIVDWKEGLKLDSDGRCIMIELNINIVIISVYCPANSMGTEDEEVNRCLFLNVLFKRAENLHQMGKQVIIMGDINVAPSLIDRDDAMNDGLKTSVLAKPADPSIWFEKFNKTATLNFRNETLSRQILNDYLYDYNNFDESKNESKILFDLGRLKNENRLKMYTCWNTLLNNRPMNIGSRIDLFLATKEVQSVVQQCGIWTFLYGSDHCPIFCDLNIADTLQSEKKQKIRHFEAISYYGLGIIKNIDSFFKSKKKNATGGSKTSPAIEPTQATLASKRLNSTALYTSRKKQKGQATLSSLIAQKKVYQDQRISNSSLFVAESDDEDPDGTATKHGVPDYPEDQDCLDFETSPKKTQKPKITAHVFQEMLKTESFNTVPKCEHSEPCVLRTAKKSPNTGRKFWCCSKPKQNYTWSVDNGQDGVTPDGDAGDDSEKFGCNFFKWAQKQ